MNGVVQKVKGLPPKKVFYALDMSDPNNPWTAGANSFINWMIVTSGGINVASNVSESYATFSIENIVDEDPEVIIYPREHGSEVISADVFRNNPAWSKTTAVKEGNIYPVDADLVNRYGPRIIDGLTEIAKSVHPEAFK